MSEEPDYTTEFKHAETYSWFYTRVFFRGELIAYKPGCRNYKRSARWARRRVRDHMRGVERLAQP